MDYRLCLLLLLFEDLLGYRLLLHAHFKNIRQKSMVGNSSGIVGRPVAMIVAVAIK